MCTYLHPTAGSRLLFQRNIELISTVHLVSLSAFSTKIQIDSPISIFYSLYMRFIFSMVLTINWLFNLPASKHVAAFSPDRRRHFRRPHSKRSGMDYARYNTDYVGINQWVSASHGENKINVSSTAP